MKKLALFLMVIALLVGLSFNTLAKPVTVEYWNLFGGGDAEFMDKMVEEFNNSQDDIKIDTTRLEWAEYYTKLKTATASGNGPDVAIAHVTRLPELVNEGLVLKLDKVADSINLPWDEFNQNILNGTIINDNHYAVPLDTHPQVFYYNKKLLKEAGLLNENGLPIMENGFMEFLKTAKEETSSEYSMAFFGGGSFRLWWGLYNQLEGSPIVSDGEITVDKEKAIKAAEFMKKLYDDKMSPLHSEYMEMVNLFRNKKAATLLTGVWITGTLENTEDLDFGVVPMPKVFNEKASWGDSHTLVIPYRPGRDEAKMEAALKFAKWMTNHGELWAKAGHIPSKNTIKEKEEFQNMPYRMDYVNAANYVTFEDAGNDTWGVRDEMETALTKVWKGELTPEGGINKGIELIERLISR